MPRRYQKLLVCIKQSAFEQMSRLKAQGQAPLRTRWERLRDRNEKHQTAVHELTALLAQMGYTEGRLRTCSGDQPTYRTVVREECHSGLVELSDLVITVGGDGTVLSAAHFINDEHQTSHVPLLGINSDPTEAQDLQLVNQKTDERRSRGALCALRSDDMLRVLPRLLEGHSQPSRRMRMQACVVSTHSKTCLAPALNDVLIAHPNPAAVSRFSVGLLDRREAESGCNGANCDEAGRFSAWSSGVWVSTATGSTAAIRAAGGQVMDVADTRLQYAIREHLLEDGFEHLAERSHGFIDPGGALYMRWNSREGTVYVDGNNVLHNLQLGDSILIGEGPVLNLYDRASIQESIQQGS